VILTLVFLVLRFGLQPILKGMKLQFGGITVASATTGGKAASINSLLRTSSPSKTDPTPGGVTGAGCLLWAGAAFTTFSPSRVTPLLRCQLWFQ
jgi:hypothetical protein